MTEWRPVCDGEVNLILEEFKPHTVMYRLAMELANARQEITELREQMDKDLEDLREEAREQVMEGLYTMRDLQREV